MTKIFQTDVLICGAGAAGLTLAIELGRRGIPFRLVEKRDTPFPGSRGKGIQPRTQEIFEDLGILDRTVALGGLYPPQRIYEEDGTITDSALTEGTASTPAEPYHLPLMVPQFLTERVMRERLAELGHAVEFACELTAFTQDEDGVTARLATPGGEETIHARYLIGADGGRSFVRKALAIGFPGKTMDVRGAIADVHLTGLDREAWHRFNSRSMERQLAICPLAGTDLFQVQTPVPIEGDIDLSPEGLNRLVAERTGRHDIRIHAVSWASAFTMNARLADHYRVGRVFLAGDAAHVHPPTGGQGLNTSVQDSYNLGWKLAAVLKGAPGTLLDSYEEERRPVAADMLGLASRLLDALKRGDIRRGREVHQLDIGYPRSTLTLETPDGSGTLASGNRAPDAPVRGAAGASTRLFNLLKGPHWTVLGYETEPGAISPRPGLHIHIIAPNGALIDERRHVRDAYGVMPGDWVLIRPDGYVSAIAAARDLPALEAHMETAGLGRNGIRP